MNKKRIALVAVFAYAIVLIKIMVLKDISMIRIGTLMLNFGGTHDGPPNLVPFKTIIPYLLGKMGLIIGGINLVGNIILLVPVGILLPLIFPDMKAGKIFRIAVASGLVIELLQVFMQVGIFDIDDVILNGLGVMMGYWAYRYLPVLWEMMKESMVVSGSVILVCIGMMVLAYNIYQETQMKGPMRPTPGAMHAGEKGKLTPDPAMADDPCRGTGGTGEIIRVGAGNFILRRNDGVEQQIEVTNETTVQSASGVETASALKPGIRVTLVTSDKDVQGRMIASFVLICRTLVIPSEARKNS